MCGVQAQLMVAAEFQLGARVDVTLSDIRAALWETRSLVKMYGPRGTLHLLPADELALWMATMRARAARREGHWYRVAGLTVDRAEAVLDAIGDALDGQHLTREALTDEVVRRTGAWAREGIASAWGIFLGPAANPLVGADEG